MKKILVVAAFDYFKKEVSHSLLDVVRSTTIQYMYLHYSGNLTKTFMMIPKQRKENVIFFNLFWQVAGSTANSNQVGNCNLSRMFLLDFL